MSIQHQDGRKEINEILTANVFVEAGAGSGKTTAMVERVIGLIEQGVLISEIVAITFTEAAAAELEDRIYQQLEARLRKYEGEIDESSQIDIRYKRINDALAFLDSAAITTIHGFAKQLLTEFSIEAKIPFVIDIANETLSRLMHENQTLIILDHLYTDESNRSLVSWLEKLDIDSSKIMNIIYALGPYWAKNVVENDDSFGEIRASLVMLQSTIDQIIENMPNCKKTDDKLYEAIEGKIIPIKVLLFDRENSDKTDNKDNQVKSDKIKHVIDLESIFEILRTYSRISSRLGNSKYWNDVDKARTLVEEFENGRDEICSKIVDKVLRDLISVIIRELQAAAELRRLTGQLEYDDLLIFVEELLETNEKVLSTLHQRYKHILIDEFQDTDPRQAKIALRLLGFNALGSVEEESKTKAMFVGDPKQSIYGFRGADVKSYELVKKKFQESQIKHLTLNFRSLSPIIDFVNKIFSGLFSLSDSASVGHNLLEVGRESYDEKSKDHVILLGEPSDDLGANVGPYRNQSAKYIVHAIETIVNNGWQIEEKTEQGTIVRNARYSDIAILVAKRPSADYIQRELTEHFIPFRLESKSFIFRSHEFNDLLFILKSISTPYDAVSIVGALKTKVYGISDVDLYNYTRTGGKFDFLNSSSSEAFKFGDINASFSSLKRMFEYSLKHGIAESIGFVIKECSLMYLDLESKRARDSWNRLRYIVSLARDFESNHLSFGEFVLWLGLQKDHDVRGSESVLVEKDDEAVRILTIHSAKGLEFPIVIVDGLDGKYANGSKVDVVEQNRAIEIKVNKDFKTLYFAEASDMKKNSDLQEQVRLYYVAFTRARDYLIVSTCTALKGSFANQFYDLCRDYEGSWSKGEDIFKFSDLPSEEQKLVRSSSIVTTENTKEIDLYNLSKMRDNFRLDLEKTHMAAKNVSASKVLRMFNSKVLNEKGLKAENEFVFVPSRFTSDISKGRGRTGFGKAVHAVLQECDFKDSGNLNYLAKYFSRVEGLFDSDDLVERSVRTILESSDFMKQIKESKDVIKEVNLSSIIGNFRVEGIVDLLLIQKNKMIIIDYKTDLTRFYLNHTNMTIAHKLQGAVYYLLLSDIARETDSLRSLSIEMQFWYMQPDDCSCVKFNGVDSLANRVRSVLLNSST